MIPRLAYVSLLCNFCIRIWEETDKHDKVLATVNYHGNVVLVPSGIIKTSCEMDTRNYPFETFTCELTFGSWVHTRFEVIH